MNLRHIAIIPDGNRRWAKRRGLSFTHAYETSSSYEHAKNLYEEAKSHGAKVFSVWGFSSENWRRNKSEIKIILKVVSNFLDMLIKNMSKDKNRFVHVGRRDRLPKEIINKINLLETKTEKFKNFTLVLCLDYGGRDELIHAYEEARRLKVKITEKSLYKFLLTKNLPDPDLIIRTGGEKRLSGFMPFQSTYSELYFTEKLFPDFKRQDLSEAIKDFHKRKRNFGK